MVACFLLFFVISFILAGLLISICLLWESGLANVSSTEWFLAGFFNIFSLILEARSTLLRQLLIDTGLLATFPAVFRLCLRKLQSCRSSVIGAWFPRAWELYAPWCAWGPRSAFFRPCTVATGSTTSDLHLGGSSDDLCPTRAAVLRLWPPSPLPAACFWVFLLFCVCIIILFLSSHSLFVF